jgi:hypothetical protein
MDASDALGEDWVGKRRAVSSAVVLDEDWAREVAAWFTAARNDRRDPVVIAAYQALERQSDRLFRGLTQSGSAKCVRVVFTRCRAPYGHDEEMIGAVRATAVLEVTTDPSRPHPVLGSERGGAYDRFRAVHDVIGHVLLGHGFDRHGEFAAWREQDRFYSGLARVALGTELHGEHSVCWTSGAFSDHKATLLPRRMVDRAREGLPG